MAEAQEAAMEFVYVVERSRLFDLPTPHGFVGRTPPQGHPALSVYLDRIALDGFFVERPYAERHSSLKQVIPYTVVLHRESAFCCTRTRRGGEARLHGKRTLGIGGHINPVDLGEEDDRRRLVLRCAHRELAEEVVIDSPFQLEFAGLINDDSTPVGSVHFGLVLLARLTRAEVRVREHEALTGTFSPVADLRAAAAAGDNFESWSSLILSGWDEVLRGSSGAAELDEGGGEDEGAALRA